MVDEFVKGSVEGQVLFLLNIWREDSEWLLVVTLELGLHSYEAGCQWVWFVSISCRKRQELGLDLCSDATLIMAKSTERVDLKTCRFAGRS